MTVLIDATSMQAEKGTFSRGSIRYPTIAISALGSESEPIDTPNARLNGGPVMKYVPY